MMKKNLELDSVPWFSLPFKDKICEKLVKYFELSTLPTVVVNAYPFTPDKFSELEKIEKARQDAQTLESVLLSEDLDFVVGKDGAKVLLRYGSKEQLQEWLIPLLNGTIRSGFAMIEPQVASSDATNIECSIRREGDTYVINGKKWWTSGAMDPRCKLLILMVSSINRETICYGVAFKRETNPKLFGYCDLDYAGDLDGRRSTSGYLFMFGLSAIYSDTKIR